MVLMCLAAGLTKRSAVVLCAWTADAPPDNRDQISPLLRRRTFTSLSQALLCRISVRIFP
jgi:hypothetical protein